MLGVLPVETSSLLALYKSLFLGFGRGRGKLVFESITALSLVDNSPLLYLGERRVVLVLLVLSSTISTLPPYLGDDDDGDLFLGERNTDDETDSSLSLLLVLESTDDVEILALLSLETEARFMAESSARELEVWN